MKFLFNWSAIAIVVLALLGCGASEKTDSPEILAKAVIKSLVENNIKYFERSSVPSQTVMDRSLDELIRRSLGEVIPGPRWVDAGYESEAEWLKANDEIYSEFLADIVADWERLIEHGKDSGIVWKEVKINSIQDEQEVDSDGQKMAKIQVLLVHNSNKYILNIHEAAWMFDQWYVVGAMSLTKQ